MQRISAAACYPRFPPLQLARQGEHSRGRRNGVARHAAPTTVPSERPADVCRVVDVRLHFIWAEGQRAMVDLLHDPAIDVLNDATLAGSPTSAQAVAKVDEARALLAVASSQFLPSVGANAGATWTDLKPRSGD